MTVSYFVRYEIEDADRGAFLAHYRDRHAPILHRFPGLRRLVLHTPAAWSDPAAVTAGTCSLLVQMEFDDEAALAAALASPARADARADFHRFPAWRGRVTHQAMESEEIAR